MNPKKFRFGSALFAVAALAASQAQMSADTLTLHPVADTTLFEANPNNNLGDGTTFQAGLRPRGGRTRALLRFDLSALPVNAVIDSASLTLIVTETPSTPVNSTFDLRRVAQSWGEGNNTSSSGGSLADPNESSWNSRFAGMADWMRPGGDFVGAVSDSQFITGNGKYTFNSTANLVTDLQSWHNDPGHNFGWILMSEAESSSRSIRRFGSRESGANAPTLLVNFTVVPEPGTATLFGLGCLGLLGWVWCQRTKQG